MYYELRDYYDVWYNETEGYFVNDSCVIADDLFIDETSTDEEILNFLVTIGYLKSANHIRLMWWDSNVCEIITDYEFDPTERPLGILVGR